MPRGTEKPRKTFSPAEIAEYDKAVAKLLASEGQEATYCPYGIDSYPCKIMLVNKWPWGFDVMLQEYDTIADQSKDLRMGHQEWIIQWDKPTTVHKFKLNRDLKPCKGQGHLTIGHARRYYCWEF